MLAICYSRRDALAAMSVLVALVVNLGGCSAFRPPQIAYDADVPPLPDLPGLADDRPRPLHMLAAWTRPEIALALASAVAVPRKLLRDNMLISLSTARQRIGG